MRFRDVDNNTYDSIKDVMNKVIERVKVNPSGEYVLAVGTDSQNKENYTQFCQVILLHEKGKGGIFFYSKSREKRIPVVKLRMLEEVKESIDITKEVIQELEDNFFNEVFDYTDYNIKFELHCDLGYNGKSKTAIADAVGWIISEFGDVVTPKIKPDSMAASHIADGHTR